VAVATVGALRLMPQAFMTIRAQAVPQAESSTPLQLAGRLQRTA
jgi:hypothetical protein